MMPELASPGTGRDGAGAALKTCAVTTIIVSFNGRTYLKDCLQSLLAGQSNRAAHSIVVVDNASSDGSAEYVTEHFPGVVVIQSQSNGGFGAGANLGAEWALRQADVPEVLVVLNQDTVVAHDWLDPLIEHLERNPSVAIVQPLIRLFGQERINTSGNRSHFLGFGIMADFDQAPGRSGIQPKAVDFASGAALAVRASFVREAGLFDPLYFMYLEDAELSWKARQAGYEVHLVPRSVVYHKYTSRAHVTMYYWLERNRWLLVLVYYRLSTLALLLPAFVLMELGQWMFAWRHGLLRSRVRVYRWFVAPAHLRMLWRARRRAAVTRKLSDRQFLRGHCGEIHTPALNSWLLKHLGNPILDLYWRVVRRILVQ